MNRQSTAEILCIDGASRNGRGKRPQLNYRAESLVAGGQGEAWPKRILQTEMHRVIHHSMEMFLILYRAATVAFRL
jgi:hypothetical protein